MSDEELIARPLEEEFDTMMDVQRNPHGAWQAIQSQAARIEALVNEAVLNKAAYESVSSLLLSVQQDCIKERQRAERLEAALRGLMMHEPDHPDTLWQEARAALTDGGKHE